MHMFQTQQNPNRTCRIVEQSMEGREAFALQASSRKQFWLLRRFLNARKAEKNPERVFR